MTGIIYAYRNKINGKHYVGQTTNPDRRKRKHLAGVSGCFLFNRAVKKYGPENFTYEILVSGIEDREDLNEWEKYFIWLFQSQKHGYNITEGGSAMDSETGKIYAKRRNEDPVWRAKNKAHIDRLTKDPAWLAFKLKQNREQSKNPEWIEANRISRERMYQDPDWIRKRKEAGAKTANDPTWRAKMKAIGQANSKSQTWRANSLAYQLTRARIVYCIDLGRFFKGVGEAGRFCGINRAGIRLSCQGKRPIAGGHLWRYATEQELNQGGFYESLSQDQG